MASQPQQPQYQIPLEPLDAFPLRQRLTQLYTIPDQPAVFVFLASHPFLAPLLIEAYPHIRTEFGQATLFLEVFVDPEAADHERLMVVISPLCEPEAAVDRHRKLRQNWWLDAM